MTHTTTDVAEARALDIARKAAALVFDERTKKAGHPATAGMERYYAKVIRAGEGDGFDAVQSALIAVRLATAEAASGAGEREGLTWRLERIIDDGGPLTLSDKAVLREARAALASLPPATDPAMVADAADWMEEARKAAAATRPRSPWAKAVMRGDRDDSDEVRAAMFAIDATRAALAAAPTIPATGEIDHG